MIRAILFDLGDTLIHYGDVDRGALFDRAARRTYALWSRRQKRMPGFRRYYLHQWFAMHWAFVKVLVFKREMNAMRYIRRACRKLCLQAEDEFYRELAWRWYEPLARVSEIEPGLRDTLEQLKQAGYAMGIVSNTFVPGFAHDRHLKQLGLIEYFPIRVYSCDVTYRKPDPRIFQTALRLIDATPAETVFVGDRIDADVQGAQRAGLFPIWKRSPGSDPIDGVVSVTSIGELPAVIERVAGYRPGRHVTPRSA